MEEDGENEETTKRRVGMEYLGKCILVLAGAQA